MGTLIAKHKVHLVPVTGAFLLAFLALATAGLSLIALMEARVRGECGQSRVRSERGNVMVKIRGIYIKALAIRGQ